MTRRSLVLTLSAAMALALGLITDTALADKEKYEHSERDHDDVWSAREEGMILPLSEVLEIVRLQIGGEIIETEFDYKQGRPVYEFKYVDGNGLVRELYVNAHTGTILKDKLD